MKLFNFLKKGNHFINEEKHRKNISEQIKMNGKTLEQLYRYKLSSKSQLKLEFFFFTKKQAKIGDLSAELKKLNYQVDKVFKAEIDNKLLVLSGWTIKMQMELSTINNWTTQMCQLGYDNDCLFDGWGTRPNQEMEVQEMKDEKRAALIRNERLGYVGKKIQSKIA